MTRPATTRLIVGPFNRVEGDLEVTLDIADGRVREARVTAPLYRGFEQILEGRPPGDALVIAPRICGICSVSQSVASSRALAQLSGTEAAPNGSLATDLVLACENVADHLTHFVLFFMPDFARACYASRPWFEAARTRFAAGKGEAQRQLVPARARFLHLMGLLAGKWPHSLAIQPGGTTKAVDAGERIRLISILSEFRDALEQVVFGADLNEVAAIASPGALESWETGDFGLFLAIARDLGLENMGRGPGTFLSHGSFGLFPAGMVSDGSPQLFDPATITEDSSHAWLASPIAHPWQGSTIPDADRESGYSWCKAPRLNGKVAEVGALARQVVAEDPLARALAAQTGGSVRDRVAMRLIEAAKLVLAMEQWARALKPGEPFCTESRAYEDGRAAGLVEAARGALGHWAVVENGRLARYQIIAPTTWNFSPRDTDGRPGALEQALVGTPVTDGETTPVAVQHVVRSFDPCMVCTVH